MSSPVILMSPEDLRELVRSAVGEALDGQRAEERADGADATDACVPVAGSALTDQVGFDRSALVASGRRS